LKLILDIDGTCNLFDERLAQLVEEKGYTFDWDHYNDWEFADYIRGAKDPKKVMDDICSTMEFWLTIPPMPYAAEILKDINKHHEIIVATKSWRDEPKFSQSKKAWMDKYFHFLHNNEFYCSHGLDKSKIPADLIFEDKPKTLEQCNPVMITVCSDRPYNKDIKTDFRFRSWKEVPRIMKIVEKFSIQNDR
jgi:5'(3')-deoxyribonucleotidase